MSQELDTNLLNSDNQAAVLGQDLVANLAFDKFIKGKAEKLVVKGIVKVGNKIISDRIKKSIAKRLEKSIINSIRKQIVKQMEKRAAQKLATKAVVAGAETVAKTAVVAGAETAVLGATAGEAGTTVAVSCMAGPTPLCVGGAVVALVMLILDITSILMLLMDTHGYAIVFDQAFIDNMAKTYKDSLNNGFAASGITDFFDTEIVFEPSDFVFVFNPKTEQMDKTPEWGPRYDELVDEYLKTKAGVDTKDWRKRAAEIPVESASAPSSSSSSKTVLIILIIFLVLLLVGGGLGYYYYYS